MNQKDIDTIKILTNALQLLQRGANVEAIDLLENQNTGNGHSPEIRDFFDSTESLIRSIAESSRFVAALSQGNLDIEPPVGNHLISPYKSLRSNLLHLTWQAKQIAMGDLSQKVDFLGELSESFNKMILSLREKSRIEEELKQSEEKYRNLFENLQDVFFMFDYTGSIEMVSPSVEEAFGFSVNEMLGRNITEFFVSSEEILNFYNALSTTRNSAQWESQVYVKTGSVKWFSNSARIIRNTDNSIKHIEALFRDITPAKTAEEALKESEFKYRTVIERSLSGIIIIQDWLIKFASPAISDMIGYTYDELVDIPFSLFVAPDEVLKIRDIHQNRLSGKPAPEKYESILIHKDGRRVVVEIKSGIMDYKSYPAVLTSVYDITERKKAEQELKLREEQLKDANAQKDKFFSILAHDLRNPFNSMMNTLLSLSLNYSNFDEESKKLMIDDLAKTVKSAFSLLESLLTWSRSQRGLIKFQPETLDLFEFAFNASYEFEPECRNKSISLKVDVPQNTLVIADRNMLSAMIRNLVTNAVKFTNAGGEISVYSVDKEDYIEFAVKDTGIGISKENLSKLFKIDETLSIQESGNTVGSGLGLLICKDFAEKHSGAIFVESEQGKGSTFRFTLKKARD